MSRDHFSVDGTLIEASASMKSFVPKEQPTDESDKPGPKGRNTEVDFKGKKRKNDYNGHMINMQTLAQAFTDQTGIALNWVALDEAVLRNQVASDETTFNTTSSISACKKRLFGLPMGGFTR